MGRRSCKKCRKKSCDCSSSSSSSSSASQCCDFPGTSKWRKHHHKDHWRECCPMTNDLGAYIPRKPCGLLITRAADDWSY